jgi:hypothetical protein
MVIVIASLILGALVGVVTQQVAAWLGATILIFAFLFAMRYWWLSRKKRNISEDVEGETIEQEEEVEFQGAIIDERDPLVRDKMIEEFMGSFHINRDKAENLYDAGYSRWSDFSEAIPEDLLMVEGVNPTVARRIISTVRSR